MSSSPKVLHAYYKGTEQRIKFFDGTPEIKILEMIKRVFKITEDNSRIYFQDEDGDILILPEQIPNHLRIYIYVEPSMTPTPSVASTSTSEQRLLPGFKWDATFSTYDGPPVVTNNGYTLGKENQSSGWTPVVSTTEYTKGKIFTKFTIKINYYQTLGIVSSNVPNNNTFCYLHDDNLPIFDNLLFFEGKDHGDIVSAAMYVDFDNRFLEYFWLQDDRVVKKSRKNIPEGPVKFFAWTKGYGITIKEEGSSPIPSYVSKS